MNLPEEPPSSCHSTYCSRSAKFPCTQLQIPHLAQLPRLSSHHSHCDFLSSQPPWLTHATHSTWSIFLSHHTCPHFQYAPFSLPLSSQVPLPTWNVFLLFLPKMIALLRASITVESVCFTALQFENSWSIFSPREEVLGRGYRNWEAILVQEVICFLFDNLVNVCSWFF